MYPQANIILNMMKTQQLFVSLTAIIQAEQIKTLMKLGLINFLTLEIFFSSFGEGLELKDWLRKKFLSKVKENKLVLSLKKFILILLF